MTKASYGPEPLKINSPDSQLGQKKRMLLVTESWIPCLFQLAKPRENILTSHEALLLRQNDKRKPHLAYGSPPYNKRGKIIQ